MAEVIYRALWLVSLIRLAWEDIDAAIEEAAGHW